MSKKIIRSAVIWIRFREDRKELYEKWAASAGLNLSEFVRAVMSKHAEEFAKHMGVDTKNNT